MKRLRRNYTVVGLVEHADRYTVQIEKRVEGRPVLVDTNVAPSAWGSWGLSRRERGILARGLTRSGRDRRPRR